MSLLMKVGFHFVIQSFGRRCPINPTTLQHDSLSAFGRCWKLGLICSTLPLLRVVGDPLTLSPVRGWLLGDTFFRGEDLF